MKCVIPPYFFFIYRTDTSQVSLSHLTFLFTALQSYRSKQLYLKLYPMYPTRSTGPRPTGPPVPAHSPRRRQTHDWSQRARARRRGRGQSPTRARRSRAIAPGRDDPSSHRHSADMRQLSDPPES